MPKFEDLLVCCFYVEMLEREKYYSFDLPVSSLYLYKSAQVG